MLEPMMPLDECERLGELQALRLLDSSREERFDRITRLAQRLFGVEIALVSLVDAERQWFKSAQGLGASETPRNISFCGHAILNESAFIIENAALDARFADNPLVTGAPHIRFYVGMPLRGPHGYRVGTLCIIDPKPRSFSAADISSLADLGMLVEAEFNARELSQTVLHAKVNEARLRAILDHVVDGIITIDEQGLIESANPAVVRMFGYAATEVIGVNIKRLMAPASHANQDAYMAQYAHGQKLADGDVGREILGQRRDGTAFALYLAFSEMQLNGRRTFSGILRDISQRKQAENELLQVNGLLAATTDLQQAILNSANFSLIATDVDGVITLFSAGAERLLGYSADEMVGMQTPAILHEPVEVVAHAQALSLELGHLVEPGFETFVAKARGGIPDEVEWTYIRKDGSRLPVMLSVTAVRDRDDVLTGYLGIAYDLTERKRIEQMKNEFISTVSHELRTPLTSIRGSLGLLAAGAVGEVPQRAHALLDIANNNCERLVRLINDILDIEKIESGNMRFDTVNQPLRPLLEQALQATQSFAAQHTVQLVLEPGDATDYVTADADRITQVMVNLLSNAAKFSPAGTDVSVRIERKPGCVRVSVCDTGAGISDEFQQRIFQKFAQADGSDTRKKGGTGLGLSISKAIVERHQGRIGFVSTRGVGTEFYFELPSTTVEEVPDKAQGRILICEDDPDIARLLGMMLEQGGLSSDIAHDAAQARALLAAGDYEAMTLDLSLPDEDGLSLLRWMRTQAKTASLPVVVVSAKANEGRTQMSGGAVGVVDWLTKPIDESKLLESLQKATRFHPSGTPSVLYIEDDPDLVRVITTMLEPDLTVEHAASMTEAIGKLSERRYSLIILDLNLPDGDGADLLAFLPALNASTPVMIYSGVEPKKNMLDKVSMALVKARTSNEQLLATIHNLIGQRHKNNLKKET